MIEIDFSSYDFDSPLGRRAALLKIPPERVVVRKYHTELLELLRREMTYRSADDSPRGEDESDCFEQIYWCGLLLYLVGDPADVPLMWEAKNINMDTGCSFDVQFLVGAGVDEAIKYLEEQGQKAPADYIKELKSLKEFDDLQGWERFRIHYFYPDIPLAGKRRIVGESLYYTHKQSVRVVSPLTLIDREDCLFRFAARTSVSPRHTAILESSRAQRCMPRCRQFCQVLKGVGFDVSSSSERKYIADKAGGITPSDLLFWK